MPKVSNKITVLRQPKGDKGDPATLYSVAPNPTQIKRDANGTPDASSFRIYSYKQIGDGVREEFPAGLMVQCVRYYTAANGAETSEHLIFKTPSATNIPTVTVGSADVRYEMFGVLPGATTAENRYTDHVTITILKDGQKGDTGATGGRGPALRGPMDWVKNGKGFRYFAGASGEPYLDYVVYEGNWYMCRTKHVSSDYNFPGSLADTNHQPYPLWQAASKVAFVATTLLLAENAVIENGIIRNLKTDAEPNRRVEITNATNAISIYNETNDRCAVMSGDTMTHTAMFGTGGDVTPSTVGGMTSQICTATQTDATTGGGTTLWNGGQTYELGSLSAAAGIVSGTIKVKVDVTDNFNTDIEASGGSGETGSDTGISIGPARVKPTINVKVIVGDTVVATVNDAASETEIGLSYMHNDAQNVSVSVVVTCQKGTGSGTWTAKPYVMLSGLAVVTGSNVTHVFANGMGSGADSTNFFEVLTTPQGKTGIRMRSGSAGLMCYNGAVLFRLAQGWYRITGVNTQGYVTAQRVTDEPDIT